MLRKFVDRVRRDAPLRIYIIMLAAGLGLLFLWWEADLREEAGQSVWVVESTGEMSFTAGGRQTVLTGIGLCADDADAYAEGTESVTMTGTIHILDSDYNVVWETGFNNLEIPVLQIGEMEGLVEEPVRLTSGETYTLLFYDDSLNEVSGITWSFYGEAQSLGWVYFLLGLGILALLSFLYWNGRALQDGSSAWRVRPAGATLVTFLGASILLIPLSFYCLPDEMTEFKEAYALSGRILQHLPGAASLSSLIPSGIARMADGADASNMALFFRSSGYGNTSLSWAEMFTASASGTDLRSLLPALFLTLVRLLKLPYQFYLIIPRLGNALCCILLMMLMMHLCPRMRRILRAVCLLPSVLLLFHSFSRQCWDIAAALMLICLCIQIAQRGGEKFPSGRRQRVGYLLLTASVVVIFLMTTLAHGFGGADATEEVTEWVVTFPWIAAMTYIRTLLQGDGLLIDLFIGPYGLQAGSVLLTAAVIITFLLAIWNPEGRQIRSRRYAVAGFILGTAAILTSALLVHSDTYFLWVYHRINGVQGSDFIPLLLLLPFALPPSKRAAELTERAQSLEPALTVLCAAAWFGAALHGIG